MLLVVLIRVRRDLSDGLALHLLAVLHAAAADLRALVRAQGVFAHAAAALGALDGLAVLLAAVRLGAGVALVPAAVLDAAVASRVGAAGEADLGNRGGGGALGGGD